MVTLQSASRTYTISRKILPSDGENILTIVNNDIDLFRSRYPSLPGDAWVNGFVSELYCYAEINSLPDTVMPEYDLGDSQSTKLAKTLQLEWGSQRFHLCLWTTDKKNPSATDWNLVGMLSLMNPMGFPYRRYRPLDLLTDELARGLGEDSKIGVSIKNVNFGLPNSSDTIVIDGTWRQEVVLLQPDFMPLIVQGSVQAVQVFDVTNTGTIGLTKRAILTTRAGRVSGSIKNTHASQFLYIKRDSAVTNSSYDTSIAPNGTAYLEQGYQGEIWAVGSAGGTTFTTNEVYK
jgi:hypothetical protein